MIIKQTHQVLNWRIAVAVAAAVAVAVAVDDVAVVAVVDKSRHLAGGHLQVFFSKNSKSEKFSLFI